MALSVRRVVSKQRRGVQDHPNHPATPAHDTGVSDRQLAYDLAAFRRVHLGRSFRSRATSAPASSTRVTPTLTFGCVRRERPGLGTVRPLLGCNLRLSDLSKLTRMAGKRCPEQP